MSDNNVFVPIKEVVIDGLVIMKIMKHSQENMPELISGLLVGLDVDETLYVSNSFPFPNGIPNEDVSQFQLDILDHFKKVNMDAYNVGCYQSTYLGSFINENFIRSQYYSQTNNLTTKNSIVLIYDQMKTVRTGALSIKAVRLTDKFLQIYETKILKENSNLRDTDITYKEIVEEIPVRIKNNGLCNAFLYQLHSSGKLKASFDNLDLASHLYLERTSEFLLGGIDEINGDFIQFKNYLNDEQKQKQQREFANKRSEENRQRMEDGLELLPEYETHMRELKVPSRLNSLLFSNQLVVYSEQINQYSHDSMSKLFLRQLLNGTIDTSDRIVPSEEPTTN